MKIRSGDAAWAAIVAYEVFCPPEELLSRALQRRVCRHRAVTLAVIGYTSLHVADLLPDRLDVYHQLSTWCAKLHSCLSVQKASSHLYIAKIPF